MTTALWELGRLVFGSNPSSPSWLPSTTQRRLCRVCRGVFSDAVAAAPDRHPQRDDNRLSSTFTGVSGADQLLLPSLSAGEPERLLDITNTDAALLSSGGWWRDFAPQAGENCIPADILRAASVSDVQCDRAPGDFSTFDVGRQLEQGTFTRVGVRMAERSTGGRQLARGGADALFFVLRAIRYLETTTPTTGSPSYQTRTVAPPRNPSCTISFMCAGGLS